MSCLIFSWLLLLLLVSLWLFVFLIFCHLLICFVFPLRSSSFALSFLFSSSSCSHCLFVLLIFVHCTFSSCSLFLVLPCLFVPLFRLVLLFVLVFLLLISIITFFFTFCLFSEEQTGKLVVLSRDVKPQSATGESPGDSRVLDLPQQTTKLYVGGIPATSIVSICGDDWFRRVLLWYMEPSYLFSLYPFSLRPSVRLSR